MYAARDMELGLSFEISTLQSYELEFHLGSLTMILKLWV